MPTFSKVLAIFVILLGLGFLWLSTSVLEARHQWVLKLKAKEKDLATLRKEIDVLTHGSEDVKKEIRDLAKTVLQNASKSANDDFDKKVNEGFDPKTAFELAMDQYIDPKTVDNYQAALRRLNDVQKTVPPDDIALEEARRVFQAADNDFQAAQRNLETALATYLGQAAGQGGIRNLLSKGMSVDDMRAVVTHIRHLIAAQQTVFNTIRSAGEKNLTQIKDLSQEMAFESNTLRLAAENGLRERDDWIKEVEQLTADLQKEKAQLAIEIEKRDLAIAQLTDLQQRFDALTKSSKLLAQQVKVAEIKIDARQGVKTAILSEDGLVPTGRVQKVDDQAGTVAINIGSRVGVKPGKQLHVYRRGENARYLGIMEVTQSESDTAVGRMLPEYRQIVIVPGDNVGPEIQ